MALACAALGEAVAYGRLDTNPAQYVRPPASKIKRARLSLEQWEKTQAELDRSQKLWHRQFARLALITGQRRADLAKMRFDDIWDDYLHVEQQKTGARIALPLALELPGIGKLDDIINACRAGAPGETILRKSTGAPLRRDSLTATFHAAFTTACGWDKHDHTPPSLHEIRSLSARLYSDIGIDAQTLLGHTTAAMTAVYQNDRGLSKNSGKWRVLTLPDPRRS